MEVVDEATGEQMVLSRGRTAPSVSGVSWELAAEPGCGYGVESSCGTITRAATLQVIAPEFGSGALRGGEVFEATAEDGRGLRIEAAVVQERGALDPECAFGSDVVGGDVELTVTLFAE